MTKATAPAKIILFGEHAVVYGRPAIAAPVFQLRARAEIVDGASGGIRLLAPDTGLDLLLDEAPGNEPLALAVRLTLEELRVESPPALELKVSSEIPLACGLGSSAAVSVALIRALSLHLGRELPPGRQSALAYEVEKIHHGTPSGIDNTVIAYGQPVYYVSDRRLEAFSVAGSFSFLIADSGIASPTSEAVAGVRERWQADRQRFDSQFDQIGELAAEARSRLEEGKQAELGQLMDRNHRLLRELGVSHPILERLIEVAREAGALGAKLSGGGLGGNAIALAESPAIDRIEGALREAGARQVFRTEVGA